MTANKCPRWIAYLARRKLNLCRRTLENSRVQGAVSLCGQTAVTEGFKFEKSAHEKKGHIRLGPCGRTWYSLSGAELKRGLNQARSFRAPLLSHACLVSPDFLRLRTSLPLFQLPVKIMNFLSAPPPPLQTSTPTGRCSYDTPSTALVILTVLDRSQGWVYQYFI